jgi:hypothetical protein
VRAIAVKRLRVGLTAGEAGSGDVWLLMFWLWVLQLLLLLLVLSLLLLPPLTKGVVPAQQARGDLLLLLPFLSKQTQKRVPQASLLQRGNSDARHAM